jgi:hypothetical protein
MSDFTKSARGVGYRTSSLLLYPTHGLAYQVGSLTIPGSSAPDSGSIVDGLVFRTNRAFPVIRGVRAQPVTDLRTFPLD